MKTPAIIVDQIINAPINKVWDALTHKRQMKHWYFDIEDFVPEYGAEFSFTAGPEGKEYVHQCKINALVEGQKIGYDWKYEGIEGDSHVTFELHRETDETTRLHFTHEGTETFPDYDGNFSRASFEAGWQGIINNLKVYLEK